MSLVSSTSDGAPFDVPAFEHWMKGHIEGFAGPIAVTKIEGGQSNPTYKVVTHSCSYVVRMKPGSNANILPTAHAIEREFRVMSALANSDVPVPRVLGICEDETVLGRVFYVMEFIEGRIFSEQSLPALTRDERPSVYDELNRGIAAIHSVDVELCGLRGFGRAAGYIERQIDRWGGQYLASVTEPIPEMGRLMTWLPRNVPDSARDNSLSSLVHGDYRLDNVMFDPVKLRAVAILDWELATIGHPLADFSYHCLSWHIVPGTFRGIAGLDLARLRIPTEDNYLQQYCDRTRIGNLKEIKRDWNFYHAFNLFRLAAILQGILKRAELGIAASAQSIEAGKNAKVMAQLACTFLV